MLGCGAWQQTDTRTNLTKLRLQIFPARLYILHAADVVYVLELFVDVNVIQKYLTLICPVWYFDGAVRRLKLAQQIVQVLQITCNKSLD